MTGNDNVDEDADDNVDENKIDISDDNLCINLKNINMYFMVLKHINCLCLVH